MKVNTTIHGNNIEVLKTFDDNCADAIITDSPYGLGKEPNAIKCLQDWIDHGYHEVKGKGFMGKTWDAFVPQPVLWKECYRVLKPGGYLLSFFGTRTYDWGTMAIRLAGFEIRDCIQWLYGSGFPKSKSHLKPANEPICVAMKPGALHDLNIDEARIEYNTESDLKAATSQRPNAGNHNINRTKYSPVADHVRYKTTRGNTDGRWPSNVILDEEAGQMLDEQSGILNTCVNRQNKKHYGNNGKTNIILTHKVGSESKSYNDTGGASRFFYIAKPSVKERANRKHPTVKPIKLMEQLIRIYCPRGGLVIDPHFGSGTTGGACINTNTNYIGIDNDEQAIKEANNFLKTFNIV